MGTSPANDPSLPVEGELALWYTDYEVQIKNMEALTMTFSTLKDLEMQKVTGGEDTLVETPVNDDYLVDSRRPRSPQTGKPITIK